MYGLFGRQEKFGDDYIWNDPIYNQRPRSKLPMIVAIILLLLVVIGSAPAWAVTLWFNDTTANLGGAATFTGTTRNVLASGAPQWNFFGCQFNTDQTGTGFVENSIDGVTWATAATSAITGGTVLDLNVPVRTQYHRCREVNGATPQTINRVVSSFRD